MADASFLGVLERDDGFGEQVCFSSRYGGPGGSDGRGLPSAGETWQFAFATGVECSYPTILGPDGRTLRRDMMEECGHYRHLHEDLRMTCDLGLRVLRYGPPYHAVNPAEGVYDWAFTDAAMSEMQRLGITPILDLLHFGVPDWLGDFQNPELPLHFARYCGAVAERYPWVRFYTPVNEIYVTAKFSGLDGAWNERLKSDRGFVTALKHCVAAATAGCVAIVRRRPDAVFVTSETAEYTHDMSPSPDERVKLENRLKFVSLILQLQLIS